MTESASEQIRQEYQRRDKNPLFRQLYDPLSDFSIYHQARLDLLIAKALKQIGFTSLEEQQILDVGCGSGEHLVGFLVKGALPQKLYGIDVIAERIEAARQRHPDIHYHEGSAEHLPWSDNTFDIISQFTVFSSILDKAVQKAISSEMQRVLKPGGSILWYDLRKHSQNPALTAFSRSEIEALFPEMDLLILRPAKLRFGITRRVINQSWELVAFLERIPLLCEMYFALLGNVPT